ncbi:MAG: GEVED domain-containing protein [Flavobacteriaceae bacterium]|nr:GEVED domain-containing protein [Flavobacteriaceae bacterium]
MKKIIFSTFSIFTLMFSWQGMAQVFLDEDFSSATVTTPPTDWINNDISVSGNVWEFNNPGAQTLNAPISDPAAIFDSDNWGGGTENAALESPVMDLSSASGSIILSFDHYFKSGFGGAYDVEVYDGTSWISVLSGSASSTANPASENIDVTTELNGVSNAQVRFRWTGDYSWYWILDNVKVASVSCLAPTDMTVTLVTDTTADLTWSAGGSGENVWNLEWKASEDFTPGNSEEDASVSVSDTAAHSATNLLSNTTYYVYYQAECGGGDTSPWVGPVSFYTGHCIPSSTSSSTYIDSFSTTGANVNVDNASTGYTNSGYGDYSQDTAIETFPGGSFDFSASIVGGSAGFALWIDLNDDLVFDTATEVLFNTTGYGLGPFTGTIEIPSNLAEGNYRLRMMTDWSDDNPSNTTGDSACSFDATRGEVEDYTVTVGAAPADAMDWNNLQWLQPTADGSAGSRTSVTVDPGTSITAYAQGYEGGVTDTTVGSAGAGIECWIGIHNENTDPATWPASAWSVATFDSEQNNNDEYKLTTTDAPVGTNYVASRWRLNNAGYTYGGTNPSGSGDTPGGPWDGTTNVSIQLVVNPIANDDCSSAIALTVNSDLACGTVTSGSVEFATDSGVTNSTCYGTEDDDVWYSFVATSEAHVVSLSNVSGSSTTDMYHVLYAGDCNTLGDAIKCSDSDTSETTELTIGDTYYVQVFTYTSAPGQNTNFDICVGTPPPPPANDSCDTATVVDTLPFVSNGDASSATNNNGFIVDCGGAMNDGVWYTFTPTVSGTIDLVIDPTGWDPEIAVYTGSCGVFTCVDFADNGGMSDSESLSIAITAGTQYFVNLGHFSSFSDSSEGVYDFTATSTDASLGIEEASISQFTYFPNPVNDVLTIKAQKTVEDITVFNMLGQVVKQQTPNARDFTVDLSAMQSGAYFVQVSIDNTVETVRVLKN